MENRIDDFLNTDKYYTELRRVIQENEKALIIDFQDFDRFDSGLADQLLEEPETILKVFQEILEKQDIPDNEKIVARIKNLPESRNIRIRNLRSEHMNKFMLVDAVIKSASSVKPQIHEAIFECPECGSPIAVEQDSNILQKPGLCASCGRRGDFPLKEKKMFDMRWLVVSEPFEVTTGEQPGDINVFLKEDLTTPKMQKKTDPGNRIMISGIMKELPKWIKGKLSTKLDIYIEANYVEPSEIEFDEINISPEDEEDIKEMSKDPKIFEKLTASIAPGIYGYNEIKESIVMQLFGGAPHRLPDGSRIRDNIHILITGDPGIGKSQILKLISSIIPRGKYVSGKSASGSGLTASAVKNETLGGWILEAGAMVLANKSVISIDEFDKMNNDDQVAMHECMSLGTISVAKASIVATLPAATSVLAGANPKLGRFDPYVPISEQINIPETLLSRFDLKFALKDRPDRSHDDMLAEHIIQARTTPEVVTPAIDPLLLRKYLAYARQITDVKLSPEAANKLKTFYVDMRNKYSDEDVPTIAITLRQYEALIRLSEAAAKVKLKNSVEVEDADRAIKLMKYSLSQLGMDPETGRIDIDRLESGISTSQRSKIRTVLEIIEALEEDSDGKDIPIEDVKAEAENRGVGKVDETLERLKNEGMIFYPRSGFVRKV